MRIVMLVIVAAALTAAACQELPSQQPHAAGPRDARAPTDSISRIFRDVLVEVAKVGEMPRLDSTALLGGVRREIRIYSIGYGQPHKVLRLIQHTHGVDGQLGLFWLAGGTGCTRRPKKSGAPVRRIARTMQRCAPWPTLHTTAER